jgi:AAA domain
MSKIVDFVPDDYDNKIPHQHGSNGGATDDDVHGEAFGFHWQWHWHGETSEANSGHRPYLVEDLLPQIGVGLISGQWGTYKSFVALDLAAAVMSNTTFIGFPVRRQGGVLFLACEGQSEMTLRLSATVEARGMQQKAPFAWVENAPRLLDPNAGQILTAMVVHASQKMLRNFGLPVVLVIIDTIGAAAGYERTGDENDATLGKIIMRNTLATAAQATNTLFLAIDHFGKDASTGTRGSSAKEDNADVVLALLGEKSASGTISNPRLATRKRRFGVNGQEFPFRVKTADMGIDQYGCTLTTLTIDWGPQTKAAKADTDRWPKSLHLLRQSLTNTLSDQSSQQKPYPNGPTVRATDIELVRTEFYRSYPAEGDAKAKQAARRQAFNRATTTAQNHKLIGIRDIGPTTWVWLANPKDEAAGA